MIILHRMAKYFWIVIALALFALLIRGMINYQVFFASGRSIVMAIIIPVIMLMSVIIAIIKLKPEILLNMAMLAIFTIIPLYMAEFYVQYMNAGRNSKNTETIQNFAIKNGRNYDPRSPLEVIEDFKKQGITAYSTFSVPSVPFSTTTTGPMFVRGSRALSTTVFCNEGGEYAIYQSDEHGFKNPPGLYVPGQVDLLAVGDSFTQGACVNEKEDIVGHVRRQMPNSINLGWNGIGPLFYYQMIVEYGQVLKPKTVLFNWFEGNDITDLREEVATPLLSKFIGRKEALGLYKVKDEVSEYFANNAATSQWSITKEKIRQTIMLYQVRKLLGLGIFGSTTTQAREEKGDYPELDRENLQKILTDANDMVKSWGGKFYFVYLPGWERFCSQAPEWQNYCKDAPDYHRQEVVSLVESLGIPLIDITEAMARHPKIADMFFYPGSHYNKNGYELAAEQIIKQIEKDKK